MQDFKVHPQLRSDCHQLGTIENNFILLHNNALVLWIIMVPKTANQDLLDLDNSAIAQIMSVAKSISNFIKNTHGYGKINFASIGNVVPQLHLHIIGRSSNDCVWPQPVWGNLTDTKSYTTEEINLIISGLTKHCGLQ